MYVHPFIQSKLRVTAIIGVALLTAVIQGLLLMLYCWVELIPALIDGVVSTGLLLLLGFLLWYTVGFWQVFQAQLVLTLLVMLIWVMGSYAGQYIGNGIVGISDSLFVRTIPLRLMVGIPCWIMLFQWYRLQRLKEWKEERVAAENLQRMQADDLPGRIAVKDGTRIHVIRLCDLWYVQASGDYVTLFTSSGSYLKEQTMKFLETHLPSGEFVRIHRSYLVNVEQIQRVELYGKETYHVFLKNGIQLRASSTGYKLLKEKLSI